MPEKLAETCFPGYTFEKTGLQETGMASYHRLQPLHKGIPVDRQVVVVMRNAAVIRIMGQLPPAETLQQVRAETGSCIWTKLQDEWLQVRTLQQTDDQGHDRTDIFLSEDGDTLGVRDWRCYFGDSTVTALVFRPDPLTVAEADYGGDLTDNNDADDPVLNGLRSIVTLTADFEADTFFLSDTYIKLKDFASPVQPVAWSLTPVFDAGRGDPAFEDVNTLYHLQQCRSWLTDLGYASLCAFQIDIDTHGAGGADNSFFSASGTPSIQFGEGGVDDAEDADVIIHEYLHALSHSAAPYSNTGLERRALDEGYADYLAASYSLSWSEFRWKEVFSWDGHNEFWDGRTLENDKHYPEDNSSNIYTSSGIWSGALAEILESIGKENTDRLVLEALYGSYDGMTMPEAALWLLDVEDLLFEGVFHDEIYSILDARGLLSTAPLSDTAEQYLTVRNTLAFAAGEGPLLISSGYGTQLLQIFDQTGRIVASAIETGPEITWDPQLVPGCYVLCIAGHPARSVQITVW